MKRLFYLIPVLLISNLQVFSQSPFRVWVNRADQNQASDGDVPGSLEIATDAGYMAVTNNGSSAFCILKYSTSGTLQWGTDFSPGTGRCGVPLNDGSYVAVGNSGGLEAVKTDANGNILWGKIYTAGTQGNYVQQTLDGGLMMGGYGSSGAVMIKTDINGNIQWAKNCTYTTGSLIIHKGVQLSDSSYVMGCCGGNGMVLFKTNKTGALQWAHEYSLEGVISYTLALRKTSDNGFIMTGTDNYEYWHVVKTDSAGNIQWANKYKPNSTQGATYDVEELDYGYAVVGMYYDGIGFSASYLMKIDPGGNVLWTRIFQEPYWNEMHSVKQTADKGLVMWGRVQTSGGQYGDLIKTDSLGLGVCGDSTVVMVATAFATTVSNPSVSVSSASSTVSPVSNSYNGTKAVESYPCALPPVAAFSAAHTTICKGDTVLFQDHSSNGPTAWEWTFNGGIPGYSTSQNPAIVYDTTGTFAVKLVAINSYGSDSITTTGYITVSTPPVPGTVTANPDSICSGSSSQLTLTGSSGTAQWQTSDDDLSFTDISSANATTYATPILTQSTYYRVDVTSLCGTDSSAAIAVFVAPLPVPGTISANPDSVCSGNSSNLTLTGSGGSIQWQASVAGSNYSNTGNDSTEYNTAALAQSTNYRVIVSNGICTDTSVAFTLVVNPSPAIPVLATGDSLICSGDSTLINSSAPYASYHWNGGDTTSYMYANSAGGYWVTVSDANGCTAVSGHQNISVYPVPSVSIIVQGDTLSSFGAVSYQWYLNGDSIRNANNSTYIASQSGNYSVEVTDTNGCKASSNSTYVAITGISEPAENNTLTIYPDPFTGTIFIKEDATGAVIQNIKIYDVLGRIMLKNEYNNSAPLILSLDVSALERGVYFIRIETNQTTHTHSIIKK